MMLTKEKIIKKFNEFLAGHQQTLSEVALIELSALEFDENTRIDREDNDGIEVYTKYKEKYYKSFTIKKDGSFLTIGGHLNELS